MVMAQVIPYNNVGLICYGSDDVAPATFRLRKIRSPFADPKYSADRGPLPDAVIIIIINLQDEILANAAVSDDTHVAEFEAVVLSALHAATRLSIIFQAGGLGQTSRCRRQGPSFE